ncbi:uncharacterized protein LOC143346774 [Colletes latitarsis]|uniref:uncharacterized protein LOC143346774 n=1 Tax=Colletes latitarsis TaxID=2605962 RepID=UPI0040352A1F
MPRICYNFAVLLIAIFLLTARTASLQNRIVVEDINYNDYQNYQNYQNYQTLGRLDKPIVVKAFEKPKNQQDFSKIPGVPGVDYPLYHTVPQTSFSCAHVPIAPGMYANVETGCQAYHICHDGREGHQGASFLCTNGTLFSQRDFACDWWYNVNCAEAQSLYRLNLDPKKNPYLPKDAKNVIPNHMRIVVV